MTQQRSTYLSWFVWFLASFFYAYQYILRVLPNIMMSDIMHQFKIDASVFGQYSGIYYLGYAGMHIPLGLLLDKYGPKKILPLCMLLTAIGLLPIIMSDFWLYPIVGRFFIGVGSSAAILGVFKIIRMSFEEKQFTRMLGFSVTIGLLGAIYGGQPVNYLLNSFGYQAVLKSIIGLGVILAIITYWTVPDSPQVLTKTSSWQDIKSVISNKMVLWICLLAGMMVGPLEGFADVWGKQYLITAYGLSDNLASTLPSMIFLGMCIGASIMSMAADKYQSYYELIIGSAVIMGLCFVGLLVGLLPISSLSIVFVIIGVFCAYQILSIYKASTYVAEHLVGLTTAIANMIIMVFGYVFHSLIGKIMAVYWDGTVLNNTPIYNHTTFTLALSIIPFALFIATMGYSWIYLREKQKIKLCA